MDEEFSKQLMGSGAANILTLVLGLIIWVVRSKCKHSRCTGNSFCCHIEINDNDESEDEDIERQAKSEVCVREETEREMQELHKRKHRRLHGSD